MSTFLPRTSAPRTLLAIALSFAASNNSFARNTDTGDDSQQQALIARLEALERRLGLEPDTSSPATVNTADLDQRLRVIERNLELQAEDAITKAAKDPVVALTASKGLSIKSPDGVELKLRGLAQADARFFVDDARIVQNDTFLFRRIRPTLEGTWGSLVGFRLTPEFAGDSATVVDAYIDLKFDPRATVRIGKLKGPVGLERLQSGSAIALAERGFPTELAPNRELGAQLQGDLFGARLNYVVGIYNGAPDGRDAATTNPDNAFDYAGRLFWEPYKNSANALSGLGFGIAASVGEASGTGNNALPRYRTPGQVPFFTYSSNVAADGLHRRLSPQGYFYNGRFGLLGEYIASEQETRILSGVGAGHSEHLKHEAWQLTGSIVLTGEDASYRGVARPNNPFAIGGPGWGAFEVVGRYGALTLDRDTFPLFANPATSARESRAWTLGLNWYLNNNLKLVANYTQASFDGGGGTADREREKSIFTRTQLSF